MAENNFSSGKAVPEEDIFTSGYSHLDCLPKAYLLLLGYESSIITMTLDDIYTSSIQKETFAIQMTSISTTIAHLSLGKLSPWEWILN